MSRIRSPARLTPDARGAVQLAEYFHQGGPGSAYPRMRGWSKQIFWGNKRARGGVLTPGGTAWGADVLWGGSTTDRKSVV